MLNKVLIENYRSCLNTRLDLHPKLSVLIGPNSSGKTNILQAIMLINKLALSREHFVRQERRQVITSRIKSFFEWANATARLNAAIDVFTDNSNNDKVLDSRQRWTFTKDRKKEFTSRLPLDLGRIEYSSIPRAFFFRERKYLIHELGSSDMPPEWAWKAIQQLTKFCSRITYYGASQFTNPGSCPPSLEVDRDGDPTSSYRIRGHGRVLHAMYSASRIKNNLQYQRFLDLVGPKGLRLVDGVAFRVVRSSSTEYSVRVGGKLERRRRENSLVIPQFKIGRQVLSPNQLSEGTFKTLVLVFHLITDDSSALLIEEPEVCVHHGLLASILEIIKSASHRKQIVLSTHSDFVLDHVKPENVLRVTFDKSLGTIVKSIKRSMTSREYAALRDYLDTTGNLGEFWREGGLGDRP